MDKTEVERKIEKIKEELKNCAEYIIEHNLKLKWGEIPEGGLKEWQDVFTASTWEALLKTFERKAIKKGLSGNKKREELARLIIRWIRNQQEALAKYILVRELNDLIKSGKIIIISPESSESKSFYVDVWMSKDILPVSHQDFVEFLLRLATHKELPFYSIPIRWKNKETVLEAFKVAGKEVWDQIEMIGFDIKHTNAILFDLKGKHLGYNRLSTDQLVNIVRNATLNGNNQNRLLKGLTIALYEGQSRMRQQISPRIYFGTFAFDESALTPSGKSKEWLRERCRDLEKDFLLWQMEKRMKLYEQMYSEFAKALKNKQIGFFKNLEVKLNFPNVVATVFMATSVVLAVEKEDSGFRLRKVMVP